MMRQQEEGRKIEVDQIWPCSTSVFSSLCQTTGPWVLFVERGELMMSPKRAKLEPAFFKWLASGSNLLPLDPF